MSLRNDCTAKRLYRRPVIILLVLFLIPSFINAQEFGASTPQKGMYLLKIFPKIFYTSAYFSDAGKAMNLPTVTGLLYLEVPVQVQYGLSGALAVGAIVPFGWTYQEILPTIREDPINRFTVREVWLTVQHRWWTIPFISSSSLRVKIPLADKEDWEDGLRIGDGQVDVFPVYYFDYYNNTNYWFTKFNIGYKYRFKNDDIKPFDELNFKAVLGYEVWERPKLDFFIYADLTRFRNGDFGEINREFFEEEGSLHTYGYGVSLEPYTLMQIYIATAGDWSGRNQYRGMRWTLGIRKALGSNK
ncbi:hypothetical protein ACFL6L_03445 [candidate division KSB1 bacterium]